MERILLLLWIAKEYGIYGFCYYHYWFGGKLLLEKPMEQMLANPKVDIPFCISWANEPWTKAWVNESKVLIPQFYGGKKEWKEHFDYLLPFFKDNRYIKEDNKPLFIISHGVLRYSNRRSFHWKKQNLFQQKVSSHVWRDVLCGRYVQEQDHT